MATYKAADIEGLNLHAITGNVYRVNFKDSTAREQIDALPVKSGTGNYSTVEGQQTTASVTAAHAEGWSTTASGNYSHSEGAFTTASGLMAHSEGGYTTASGLSSHAEGTGTISNHSSQHVFGEYNAADPSENAASVRGTYVEIVGNGNSDNTRSNARTLDWSGNEALAGSITLGKGTVNETTITAAQLKALLALLN